MRRVNWFGTILLQLPVTAFAGQIYGSLTTGGAAVPKADIEINCGGNVTRAATSSDGSYRANVPQQGRCTLTVASFPGRPSAAVFSYPNPAQYDFQLVKRPDGSYELRRQ